MAKYIDIDKAQLEFYKAHEGDEFTPNIITLQTFLLYYPPADVRPVRRGEWKSENTDALTLSDVRTCSVCGLKKVSITNFCPSCGADMRGESEGGKG